MEPISGIVGGFSSQCGRTDVRVTVGGRECFVLVGNAESDVTVNGLKVTSAPYLLQLLARATSPVRAELYPLTERYGAALKAVFTQD